MKNNQMSVIVTVYNIEQYIEECIVNILSQKNIVLELILVDDGSPDDSGKIADEYAAKDSRIKSFHKKNGGCCDARNFGLSKVTGEYTMLADGDDWLELDCVDYLVRLAEDNKCQMAMSDCIFTTSDRQQNAKDNVRIWTPERATCAILYVETPVGPWNKLYTTHVIRDNNIDFSVPWFGEGLYFSVTNAQYSNSVAVGHRKVYNYRLNNIQSGTTERKVLHAVNSLWNIRNIKNKLHIKTTATINACNWHIHRNCFNLLWYVIGSGIEDEYKDLYTKTHKELLNTTPSVLIHSKVSLFNRFLIIATALMPRTMARIATIRRMKKTNKKFK